VRTSVLNLDLFLFFSVSFTDGSLTACLKKKLADFVCIRSVVANTLRYVVWVYPFQLEWYRQFGVKGVVIYDNTYRTNRIGYRLGTFTGINGQGRSVTFGHVLMANEDTTNFVGVFSTWLELVGKAEPDLFVTDHDAAEQVAVQKVFTTSAHALCVWYALSLHHVQEYGRVANAWRCLFPGTLPRT